MVPTESLPVCLAESLYNYEDLVLVSSAIITRDYQGISTLGDDNGIILPRLRPGASLRQLGPRRGPAFVLMCIFICSDINNHVSNAPDPLLPIIEELRGDMIRIVHLLRRLHAESR